MLITPSSLPLLLSVTTLLASFTDYNSGPLVVSAQVSKESDISYKSWHELGHGIGDEYLYDKTGYAVASDAFGDTIAIGSPTYDVPANSVDETSKRAGRVRLYDYNEDTDDWDQIGADIVGNEGDEFGTSVALSVTGTYLVVGSPKCSKEPDDGDEWVKETGCVRVYERADEFGTKKEVYTKLGNTVYGTDAFDHFGFSVDIHDIFGNDDEEVEEIQVAIGAPGAKDEDKEQVGKVFFMQMKFGNDDNNWKFVGEDGTTERSHVAMGTLDSRFGSSVSLSMDDGLLIVGAPMDSSKGKEKAGAVQVFKRDDDDVSTPWSEMIGLSYYGDDQNDQCGASVSITLRGDFFAYGCPHASNMGPGGDRQYQAGKVEVREIFPPDNDTSWIGEIVAEVIWGEHGGDFSGSAIDIGQDGQSSSTNLYIAIGAPNNYPSPEYKKAGHVRVYHLAKNQGGNRSTRHWLRANLDLNGGNSNDKFGTSVAISYDGHRMVGGAPGTSGYATSYELLYTEAPSFAPTPSDFDGIGPMGKGKKGGSDIYGDDYFYKPSPFISPLFVMLVFFVVIPAAVFFGFKAYVQYRTKHPLDGGSFGAVGTNDDYGVATPRNDLELTPASSDTRLGVVGVGVGTGSVTGAGAVESGVVTEPVQRDII